LARGILAVAGTPVNDRIDQVGSRLSFCAGHARDPGRTCKAGRDPGSLGRAAMSWVGL